MNLERYGTFRDSLQAPIHRWFTYPAGYSYKLVEAKLDEFKIRPGDLIGDPFVGTGTTSLSAKLQGVDSVGIEAHPFVCDIAKTKMNYEYCLERLAKECSIVISQAGDLYSSSELFSTWPPLIHKCFSEENLKQLYGLRSAVELSKLQYKGFFKVALTATLRDTTSAGAGWPYIAPSKFAERKVQRNAFDEFKKRCALMQQDIAIVLNGVRPNSKHKIVNGDARKFSSYLGENRFDLVLTSPPYLNNYDYADRTRLETYFWGIYHSWSDITLQVRDKLIIAATTQIRRNEIDGHSALSDLKEVSPKVYNLLLKSVDELSKLRKEKSGKKSYDLMVARYFQDMTKVILSTKASLKKGSPFILVLGDSAPYGVHIPTDKLISQIALDAGFSQSRIEVLRARGEKWANNSQRHRVPLRESIVTLIK